MPKLNRRGITGIAAAALAVIGSGTAFAAVSANPVTTVTAVTHVSDRPDNGHGTPPVWAYDTFDRTLTVTLASPQPATLPTGIPAGDLAYTVTIADKGSFRTILGAGAPDQAAGGLKISHSVKGSVNGTYALTAYAPAADALAGTVPAAEEDNFSAATNGFVSTGDWAKQAFATQAGVTVSGGAYSWTYATGCETWTDTSSNGDGNFAADGNITGKICKPVPPPVTGHPYFLHGKWTARTATTAQVSWDTSATGWPSADHCALVYITGYGFGPLGDFADAHVGFTCDNGTGHDVGYLWGLKPDHTYALQLVPETGGSYFDRADAHPVVGGAAGYVDVFTLADFHG
jgi:hypothetical protein